MNKQVIHTLMKYQNIGKIMLNISLYNSIELRDKAHSIPFRAIYSVMSQPKQNKMRAKEKCIQFSYCNPLF